MARENYKFGKRQRELAKKQKKQEKLQRKQEKLNNPGAEEPADGVPVTGEDASPDVTDAPEAEP